MSSLSGLRVGFVWNLVSFCGIAVAGLALNLAIGRVYGPAPLGNFNVVLAIYTVAAQFSTIGIQFAMLRRLAIAAHEENADPTKLGLFVSNALSIVTLSSILVGLITVLVALAFGGLFGSAAVQTGLLIIAPGLLFFSLNKILLATFNALNMLRAFAALQALRYALIIGFLALWILLDLNPDTLAGILTCGEFVLTCVLLFMVRPWARLTWPDLHSQESRELINFGSRALWGGAVVELNAKVDILVLAAFASPTVVGIYSIAALIYEGLMQLPLVVRNVINAKLAILARSERQAELTAFLRPVKRSTAAVMALVVFTVVLVYPSFADVVLVDPVYRQAWLPLCILVTGIAFASPYLPLDLALSQAGQPWIQTLQRIGVVGANIILNLALVPFFGTTGAAFATALATVIGALLTWSLAKRVMNLNI